MEILLENYEENIKKDIVQKVKGFKLSNKITVHRIEDLSDNIKDQFKIEKSQVFCSFR